jgi:hypothetical protein
MLRRPSAERVFPEARDDRVVVEELDGEILIYDLERDEAHCLGETAAHMWKHCDGRTSVASLTKLLPHHVDDGAREGLVWEAIDQLSKRNLLEKRVAMPEGGRGRSRRDFIVRVGGAGAAAAVGASLIRSIVVAPPAAHASHLGSCASCNTAAGSHPCTPGLVCCPSGSGSNHAGKCGKAAGGSCIDGRECCSGCCRSGLCRSGFTGGGNCSGVSTPCP